jgi:hypothetical protein
VLRAALADVRARRGRALLAAIGIAAAALMAGTAITVSYGLGSGFDRAARRADLPDAIVRFDARAVGDVDRRVRALPNVRARSYRYEGLGFQIRAGAHASSKGALEVVLGRPRGYAVVSGRDLGDCGCDVVVERGLARAWGLRPGSRLAVEGFGVLRVRGIAVAPDNVAFPLSSVARVWIAQAAVRREYGRPLGEANVLQIWAHDRAALAPMLAQAREASFGLDNLRILTRTGVRVLVDRARGSWWDCWSRSRSSLSLQLRRCWLRPPMPTCNAVSPRSGSSAPLASGRVRWRPSTRSRRRCSPYPPLRSASQPALSWPTGRPLACSRR